MAHDIDYKLYGDDMQFVEIELDNGESIVAEAGAMMYMDHNIDMDTIFGDGSEENQDKGFMGKLASAGKRVVTGESLFMTQYTNNSGQQAHVAFASPYPGKIIAADLSEYNGKLICQKDAFLCAAKGVSIGIQFQRKLGAGFFGGEGFIMQKLEGDGKVFFHAGGTIIKKELQPGQVYKVDTGCLVGLTSTVNYDVQMVGSIKTGLFGGEGLFLATLQGPGTIWLQSLPFSRMADRVISASRVGAGAGKGESKVSIGNLFD